jgi:hypothetical protein
MCVKYRSAQFVYFILFAESLEPVTAAVERLIPVPASSVRVGGSCPLQFRLSYSSSMYKIFLALHVSTGLRLRESINGALY